MVRTERVQVRFPPHIKKVVERMAEERGMSEGSVVADIVERALSVDPEQMNEKIIAMHEVVHSLLVRIEALEKEHKE